MADNRICKRSWSRGTIRNAINVKCLLAYWLLLDADVDSRDMTDKAGLER